MKGVTRSIKLWKLKDLVPAARRYGVVDAIPHTPFVYRQTELVERLNAGVCERPAGSPAVRGPSRSEVERAHRDDDYLSYMRAARSRKHIVSCVDCHEKVHSYRPYTRPPRQLGSGEPDAVKAPRPVRRGSSHVLSETGPAYPTADPLGFRDRARLPCPGLADVSPGSRPRRQCPQGRARHYRRLRQPLHSQ